jgi:hypothetical protein
MHGIPELFALIDFEFYMREAEDLVEGGCETLLSAPIKSIPDLHR